MGSTPGLNRAVAMPKTPKAWEQAYVTHCGLSSLFWGGNFETATPVFSSYKKDALRGNTAYTRPVH